MASDDTPRPKRLRTLLLGGWWCCLRGCGYAVPEKPVEAA